MIITYVIVSFIIIAILTVLYIKYIHKGDKYANVICTGISGKTIINTDQRQKSYSSGKLTENSDFQKPNLWQNPMPYDQFADSYYHENTLFCG